MKSQMLYSTRVSLAVLVSGASALTYEIVWQRQMYLIFGASAPASTAILTAIFLGIALGSRLVSPLSARMTHPARVYAGLELAMGAWGLIVPWALRLSEAAYLALANAWGEESPWLALARFVLAVLPLLPATLAMGATIPVMIQTISRPRTSAVAWAYGLNILGAMMGCLFAGFYALKVFGISGTSWVAVALNAFAFLLLITLPKLSPPHSQAQTVDSGAVDFRRPAWLAPAYFLAGFVALGLEVVWLRFLGIVNSNSTVTFTLTLVIYLLGMGLGSLIVYPVLRRRLSGGGILVLANIAIAVTAMLTFQALYAAIHVNYQHITLPAQAGKLTVWNLYAAEGLNIAYLLFLPTLFMGLVYPATCDLGAAHGSTSPTWNAKAYFLGTLGSVAGILLVSLVIIPRLGLHGSFSVLVGFSLLCGGGAAWFLAPKRRPLTLLLIAALCIWAGSLSLNPKPVLQNTVARQESGHWVEYSIERDNSPPLSELVYVKAGRTGTVIIKKSPHSENHFIHVDDQLVASTNLGAKVDAYMLAHLPLLLHPDPQSALTVGFGSGGTSHAMTTHGVQTVCVEIEEEVANAAYFLTDQNYGVMNHPRFKLILNDARDHLNITRRMYDVISTDVTNLQYKQNGSLYAVEYFELMKDRLNEGGIACAWIPMASISTRELQILMQSFRHVFPHATLWFMNHTHTNFGILVGTPDTLRMDFARFQEGFDHPEIGESLRQIGMTDPLQLVHCLHLDESGYAAFCGEAPLHTDDLPVLEFSSPLSTYRYFDTFLDNMEATLPLRPRDLRNVVENLPSSRLEQFKQHQIASARFCEVVLLQYRFIVNNARGDNAAALQAYERAEILAKEGLAAWPEDSVREDFYARFERQALELKRLIAD